MKKWFVKMFAIIVMVGAFFFIGNANVIAAQNVGVQNNRVVYTTKTGKCYHFLSTCPRGKVFTTTLSKVKMTKLRPCSKCCH